MDIPGALLRKRLGNQLVLVITDHDSKLTRAVSMTNTTAPHVGTVCLYGWVLTYCIPVYLLTDNGPQFVPKFFASICPYLGAKLLTTTAYHPQTKGQTE